MTANLTLTDLFCGAGGSSTGATSVPGVNVRLAANHWDKAIETHNANHPDTDHLQADISHVDPRYVPRTDLLWASPECTNHSRAKGRKLAQQPDLFGDVLPEEAVERSRATMWDVVRFTEAHEYRAVLVENVVEVVDWTSPNGVRGGLFDSWLHAMHAMGYDHRIISLNSMHAQTMGAPAPQSRDRVYIAFWRKGERAPDFERMQRPKAWCPTCETVIEAMQSWKRNPAPRTGRYRQQYVYRCPSVTCRNQVVEPGWLPASSIIDWSLSGERIGDRAKPLADKTMRRIQMGIDRYWSPLLVENGGNPYDAADPKHPRFMDPDSYYRAWPITEPTQTMHTRESKGLAYAPVMVPVEGRDGKQPMTMTDPLRTQTTRNESGVAFPPLMVPAGGTWNDDARPADLPARARTTRESEGLAFPPFIAEMRGGGSWARPASDPLATVTASGNHHGLVSSARVLPDPAGEGRRETVDINDVRFRMLEPHEIKQAMAFPADYVMVGNRREQVKLSGNAVTPPAARDLIATVVAAVTGEDVAA